MAKSLNRLQKHRSQYHTH